MADLEWPDTTPPDKSDEFWEVNNNLSINGTPYRKEEVAPDRWQWVVDQERMEWGRRSEQARRDLWWALRTRLLSDEEMERVRCYGDSLNIEPMQSYNAHQKAMELNAALARQAELSLLAQRTA